MTYLFNPLQIKEVKLKNRIVVSPMCQYSANDGFINDWHIVHLGSRASGGAALVFVEATAVTPEGRITPGDAGIWKDDHIAGLTRMVNFIHSMEAAAGIQIAHAGRKASCAVPWEGGLQLTSDQGGWQTISPSDKPFRPGDRIPLTPDNADLLNLVGYFRDGARRALKAGFDVLEIHAAHGYLLHEFLSPYSNFRKDEYGGSFENRIRLLIQVVNAVKEEWPVEKPLFVRISATEWNDVQFSPEEAFELAGILKDHGVDLIDCSSGGNVYEAKIPTVAGYQVIFAESIKKAGILTGAVGLITNAKQADAIIRDDKADLIFMGRELLRNPYFPLHAARELSVDIQWPVQYLRAKIY